jgi:RimJ/RimL family protein N-acetyltransferase
MWGKGIATRALSEFVAGVEARPLHAHVAKHHVASIRVLEKCGFTLSGEDNGPDRAGGTIVEEFIYTLAG